MKKIITIRKDLKKWKEYTPVPSAESISLGLGIKIERVSKLDAGENAYGPSPWQKKDSHNIKGINFTRTQNIAK